MSREDWKEANKKRWRKCSLCNNHVHPKESGSVIAMRAMKFYQDYNRDVGEPKVRKNIIYCPEHTRSFLLWQKEQLEQSQKKE